MWFNSFRKSGRNAAKCPAGVGGDYKPLTGYILPSRTDTSVTDICSYSFKRLKRGSTYRRKGASSVTLCICNKQTRNFAGLGPVDAKQKAVNILQIIAFGQEVRQRILTPLFRWFESGKANQVNCERRC